jgi:hypothetical protein
MLLGLAGLVVEPPVLALAAGLGCVTPGNDGPSARAAGAATTRVARKIRIAFQSLLLMCGFQAPLGRCELTRARPIAMLATTRATDVTIRSIAIMCSPSVDARCLKTVPSRVEEKMAPT